jgi:hypothetical protein
VGGSATTKRLNEKFIDSFFVQKIMFVLFISGFQLLNMLVAAEILKYYICGYRSAIFCVTVIRGEPSTKQTLTACLHAGRQQSYSSLL